MVIDHVRDLWRFDSNLPIEEGDRSSSVDGIPSKEEGKNK